VLDPINPAQTTLGITNVSFVAQSVDWNPVHLLATLRAAHAHPGFSFVRILQRCPHFQAGLFEPLQQDPSKLLLLTHPDGVEADPALDRIFPNRREHDPSDLHAAREVAGGDEGTPIGLLYRNPEADRYDSFTAEGIAVTPEEKLEAVRAELARYRI
jgi:2-oxoglutarate ferredoxin oxidoreductase subunit beta